MKSAVFRAVGSLSQCIDLAPAHPANAASLDIDFSYL